MGGVKRIHTTKSPPQPSVANLVDRMSLHIPLAGLINPKTECARLRKEQKKLETMISQISAKLGNQNFLNNAPTDVIKKEKEKLIEARGIQDRINVQFEKFLLY